MAELVYSRVKKVYGKGEPAVKDFSLCIKDGEFTVIVGPSGCGKSTILRMTAGLETVTEGTISVDGSDVTKTEPRKRDMAMVFQNYALYENMTVYQNLAFPLKMRKMKKPDIDERVLKTAEILEITELLDRKPGKLSGGERQRTAIGRAIIREPKIFLMDEPLSNLDAKLRVQLRGELKRLHERLGITTLYVTHDKSEAMFLADRIVVMKDGEIVQSGTPDEIYRRPVSYFTADFFEDYSINRFVHRGREYFIRSEALRIVHPSREKYIKAYMDMVVLHGKITGKDFLGGEVMWRVKCGEDVFTVTARSRRTVFDTGSDVLLIMDKKDFFTF